MSLGWRGGSGVWDIGRPPSNDCAIGPHCQAFPPDRRELRRFWYYETGFSLGEVALMATVRDVTKLVDMLAPPYLAAPGDTVGLMVGDPGAKVTRVLVALDATVDVLEEASRGRAQMIVTHHPLLRHPPTALREDDAVGRVLLRTARAGLSIYAAHTNLDRAPGGVNDTLAAILDLKDIANLADPGDLPWYKLVVFVPVDSVETVAAAMCDAGAGGIGKYECCTFRAPGMGTFKPGEGSRPALGKKGRLNYVEETRLELMVDKLHLDCAVGAMKTAHPYEEVAYDVYKLENMVGGPGMGRIGYLPRPVKLDRFAAAVRDRLGLQSVRVIGDGARRVVKIGVVAGGGGSAIPAAKAAGVDVMVTGDVNHHLANQAVALDLPVVDGTHAATERPAIPVLADGLARLAKQEKVAVTVTTSRVEELPWREHMKGRR